LDILLFNVFSKFVSYAGFKGMMCVRDKEEKMWKKKVVGYLKCCISICPEVLKHTAVSQLD
jgi:hypothetical protein